LPRASLARRDAVRQLVRARVDAPRHERATITHAFAFKDGELQFARELLQTWSCLWLYRVNQRAFGGDFVVVDVSSPVIARRPAYAIDLKRARPLRLHDGTGVQLRNAPAVVQQIAATGVVDAECRPSILTGDARELLAFFAIPRKR
jgi:hypothetical protein